MCSFGIRSLGVKIYIAGPRSSEKAHLDCAFRGHMSSFSDTTCLFIDNVVNQCLLTLSLWME